jgi:hypothetical protein
VSDLPNGNGKGQLSVNMKDVSDWIKILLLLGGILAGYIRLSDQVADHTGRLEDVQSQIRQMRGENEQRNTDLQRKVGSIQMYICSKDSTHCTPDDSPH